MHRIVTAENGTAVLDGTPRALIIVPTRELCIQVARDLENASKYLRVGDRGLQVLPIYGGRPYEAQISALQKGVDVVVGTRSAVFAPIDALGLIVVDEEHDSAFKQEDAPIYHARDMAVVRAHLGKIPVMLVSATPSLETVQNVAAGRYGVLRMPELNSADLPGSQVADVMGSAKLADYFEVVIIALEDWALVARRSADAFEAADRDAAIAVDETWSAPR